MSPKNRLFAFGEQVGFYIETESDVVRAVGVRCLLKDGNVGTCIIEKSCDPTSKKPTEQIGGDVHGVKIIVDKEIDGRIYNVDGSDIGTPIGGDGKTWSHISIRKGTPDAPEKDESVFGLIHRYAKHIVGAASGSDNSKFFFHNELNSFKIPNIFEARTGITSIQDKIRNQKVAIIGLGGTGAYILDLLVKTPVKEIHLLDSDCVNWHNLMRAPGAPTVEEKNKIEGCIHKVHYYHSKYDSLRNDIYPHAIRIDSPSIFSEFLANNPIDFAFVCIDQFTDKDFPRQDMVYLALMESKIPFIDSGVSITLGNHTVKEGAVTTSYYEAGSEQWKAIPNSRVKGNNPGYRNVQLPEVNALAASLAVMEWRRRTEQYVAGPCSFLHKFLLETLRIVRTR